jgi:putative proteasome-type protease
VHRCPSPSLRADDAHLESGPMTYCLAARLDEGLVFLADTRTNAGIDNISTYRKLHVLRPAPDRIFVLESAGNLATTQEVLDRLDHDLRAPGDHESLLTVQHLYQAALYLGRVSQSVAQSHLPALAKSGADGTATFILGGQVGDDDPDILLVYPEGNYIRASDDRPFLQIGESKYGKYLLDVGVTAQTSIDTTVKVALGSMMSTARANLSVGPPYDGATLRNDGQLNLVEFRVEADSATLTDLHQMWEKHIHAAIADLPGVAPEDIG